jgi:hypothetical protein
MYECCLLSLPRSVKLISVVQVFSSIHVHVREVTTSRLLVLVQLLELRLDDVIRQGRASLAAKDAIIAAALETSFKIQLGGGEYGTCLVSATHNLTNWWLATPFQPCEATEQVESQISDTGSKLGSRPFVGAAPKHYRLHRPMTFSG